MVGITATHEPCPHRIDASPRRVCRGHSWPTVSRHRRRPSPACCAVCGDNALLVGGLLAAISVAIFSVPWHRLAAGWQRIPSLAFLAVLAIVRHLAGGAGSNVGLLVLVPVLWFALYGTRRDLIICAAAVTAVFAVPAFVVDGASYPIETELQRTTVWLLATVILGFTVQRISMERRAAHLRLARREQRFRSLAEHLPHTPTCHRYQRP